MRFYMVVGLIPLLVLFSWKLALSQTAGAYADLKKLKHDVFQYADPNGTLLKLQKELSFIQEGDASDPQKVDEHMMDVISENMSRFRIRLEEFPETHSYTSSTYQVKTFRLRFSGMYTDLLRFINFAEYEIGTCKIVSVAFERKEHRKTGEKLFVDLYFQSVYNAKQSYE